MTLEQVVNIIRTFANAHLQIASFFEGRISEENLAKNVLYYRMMIEYVPSQLDQGNETFEFRVGIFGRVNVDVSNRLNVLSDTRQIATDLVSYFKNNPDNTALRISLPIQLNDYFEWSGDGVAGHFFDLVLNQYQGLKFCGLPITSTTTPEIIIDKTSISFELIEVGVLSDSQTLAVSGLYLTTDMIVTCTDGFIINLDNSASNDSPISTGDTTIYVSFFPILEQDYSGTITITSPGAVTKIVTLSGTTLSKANKYLIAANIPNDNTLFYAATPYQRTGAQITTYVTDLFTAIAPFYSKVRTLYLFGPGDSVGNSLNAISPLFTDSSFRLVYERTGTITHDGTGINVPAGADANTKHIPYCDGYEYITGEGWTWYSATNVANVGYAMGTYSNAYYYCDNADIYLGCGSVGDRFASFATTFKGLNIVNRDSSTPRMQFFKNGSLYLERDLPWQYSGSLEFLLGGTRDSSSGPNFPYIPANTALNFGFMANHFGLTPSELITWNTAVTNFLISMGRI